MMERGYLLQKLHSKEKILREKNGFLQEKLSHYLSLGKVESYAREKLGLTYPKEVRFLEEKISPPTKSSSPPPSLAEKARDLVFQVIWQLKHLLNLSPLKDLLYSSS